MPKHLRITRLLDGLTASHYRHPETAHRFIYQLV
jgi:hypothetical protein